ncbi:hypothetical protein OsJ_11148 [Oryza sativa Japonica Group]|uniref:Uncharacterized protein n=1 Tax=Oryza sativa subsp. japonica TaxID=39947 RepID=B9F8V3_ORYSJ|nr:hypothetical protein OsJ_11148 [Oryza sativa Japonica Group]
MGFLSRLGEETSPPPTASPCTQAREAAVDARPRAAATVTARSSRRGRRRAALAPRPATASSSVRPLNRGRRRYRPPPRGPRALGRRHRSRLLRAALAPRPPPSPPTRASSLDPAKGGPDPNSTAPDLAVLAELRPSCSGLIGAPNHLTRSEGKGEPRRRRLCSCSGGGEAWERRGREGATVRFRRPRRPWGGATGPPRIFFLFFFLLLKTIKTIFCRNILEVVTYLLSKKEIARASGNWRQKRLHGSFVLHADPIQNSACDALDAAPPTSSIPKYP